MTFKNPYSSIGETDTSLNSDPTVYTKLTHQGLINKDKGRHAFSYRLILVTMLHPSDLIITILKYYMEIVENGGTIWSQRHLCSLTYNYE